MENPYDQFTSEEIQRIRTYLPVGEKAGLNAARRAYLTWVVISIAFLTVYFATKEISYAVSSYLALLIPFIWGALQVKKQYQLWARIVQKYDRLIKFKS